MATKKTYKPKVEGYVPEALDGDGDGLVQDGTEFERPVGTEIDTFVEVEEVIEITDLGYHIIADGENIQTIAAKYLPKGMNRNEFAKQLYAKNKNWSVGAVIHLG